MQQRSNEYTRYCPGEEHIFISDAVCFGRQRVAFHKCRDCQFRDQTGVLPGMVASGSRKESAAMIESLFKAYDVRATTPEPLNEDAAWRIGYATAQYLTGIIHGSERGRPGSSTIAVGRDMRTSGPALAGAFVDGARRAGCEVIDVGMIDTPQIYFAVNHLGVCGGVQTTASHNPAHYNGFKICGQKGKPIGEDTGLRDIGRIASRISRNDTAAAAPLRREDLTEPYKAFVRGFLRTDRQFTVAVDASNGMAGKLLPLLFGDAGNLKIIPINFEHDGTFVHEPNPLVDANLEQVREAVREHGADFGVCFDGDADRLILVDEKAEIVRCDLLTAALAAYFLRHHPGSTVVYDLRSSRVVKDEIEKNGGTARRERVGHAFMKKALADTKAVFGGELSGHFYFADNWYCDSGMLALAHTLNMLAEAEKPLSKIIKRLKRYRSSGEINFENERKDETIQKLAQLYEDADVDFLDGITVRHKGWWFNVRKSNTEPLLRLNLEVDDGPTLEERIDEVARHLGRRVAH